MIGHQSMINYIHGTTKKERESDQWTPMEKNILEPLFIDTSFFIALLNESDQYHWIAKKYSKEIRQNKTLYLTEGIIMEIGDAFCKANEMK